MAVKIELSTEELQVITNALGMAIDYHNELEKKRGKKFISSGYSKKSFNQLRDFFSKVYEKEFSKMHGGDTWKGKIIK